VTVKAVVGGGGGAKGCEVTAEIRREYYSSKRYDGACAPHTRTTSEVATGVHTPGGRAVRSSSTVAAVTGPQYARASNVHPADIASTTHVHRRRINGHPIVLFRTMPPRTVAPTTVLPFIFYRSVSRLSL